MPQLASLEKDEHHFIGLTNAEATNLLNKQGPNEIKLEEGLPPWKLFIGQLNSPMIGLLFFACVIALLMGEILDAIAIGAIVILNAVVGFVQEYQAEKALSSLRAMTAPKARVVRDGRSILLPAREVVPGDLLVLEAGDIIAADARLSEAHSFYTNEAPLTGESLPVGKRVGSVPNDVPLAERKNAVFLGTSVIRGTGMANVVATGMQTELGKVAHLLQITKTELTPLQLHLRGISQKLMFLCLAIVAVVGIMGFLQGRGWFDILLASVSLAVAAVPEGLPTIVTIALALGVKRMAARNVLVRKLPAVETLGSVTVICTDKTGTLTTGVMTVRELWGEDHHELLFAASACCDAELSHDKRSGTGDSTEVAILLEAIKHGIVREQIEHDLLRWKVNPFDSDRKRMSIMRSNGVLYVKGAVESLLPLCSKIPAHITRTHSEMAEEGLRVLAVAVGKTPEEKELTLLGLIGIADPPRTETIAAIRSAKRAGIRTVMITGDHPKTARAIARELGIIDDNEKESNYSELVHARATPQDKIDIIRFWKNQKATVAMTGDGVNDAPALKEAHIGISMGKTGTEVAREASDMVLTDDNFSSIIAAVQEGRGIYTNIQKATVYLLTGNFAELIAMLVTSAFFLPIPFLPIHLLWINLVTDGLPALALVMDPIADDVLRKPPRDPSASMLGKVQYTNIVTVGLLEAAVVLSSFFYVYEEFGIYDARNFAFNVLVFSQMFRALGARSATQLHWQVGTFSNLPLLFVIFATILVQVSIHYMNITQAAFQIKPLPAQEFASAILLGLMVVSVIEISKLLRRYLRKP